MTGMDFLLWLNLNLLFYCFLLLGNYFLFSCQENYHEQFSWKFSINWTTFHNFSFKKTFLSFNETCKLTFKILYSAVSMLLNSFRKSLRIARNTTQISGKTFSKPSAQVAGKRPTSISANISIKRIPAVDKYVEWRRNEDGHANWNVLFPRPEFSTSRLFPAWMGWWIRGGSHYASDCLSK